MEFQTRTASCSCGHLQLTASGDPATVSVCHCYDCQKRTGSAFGAQLRFKSEQVITEGEPRTYVRQGDTGASVTFSFCPQCGTTLWWNPEKLEGYSMVALGAFQDGAFGSPDYSVYETRQHPWVQLVGEMDHYD